MKKPGKGAVYSGRGSAFSNRNTVDKAEANPTFDAKSEISGTNLPFIDRRNLWDKIRGVPNTSNSYNNQLLAQYALLKAQQPMELERIKQTQDMQANAAQKLAEAKAKLDYDYKNKATTDENIARGKAALLGLTTGRLAASQLPNTQDYGDIGNYFKYGQGSAADVTGLFDSVDRSLANRELLENQKLTALAERPNIAPLATANFRAKISEADLATASNNNKLTAANQEAEWLGTPSGQDAVQYSLGRKYMPPIMLNTGDTYFDPANGIKGSGNSMAYKTVEEVTKPGMMVNGKLIGRETKLVRVPEVIPGSFSSGITPTTFDTTARSKPVEHQEPDEDDFGGPSDGDEDNIGQTPETPKAPEFSFSGGTPVDSSMQTPQTFGGNWNFQTDANGRITGVKKPVANPYDYRRDRNSPFYQPDIWDKLKMLINAGK